ncbi:hypothetical protein [Acinetobacter bereziniae]|uniref:hypothetical protein n=1 Tax=Acinetobacter bereziniae TaxID=106648 RepID=UPI00124F8EBD|nr:hypothetical protein [Acinetobacter bereziniae]
MSDSYEHKKPYSLTAAYLENTEPTKLAAPYDLHTTFDEAAGGETRAINTIGFDAVSFGFIKTRFTQIIYVSGLNQSKYGTLNIFNKNRYYNIQGFDASSYGKPSLNNTRRYIQMVGIKETLFGSPKIYNNRQIISLNNYGFNASTFGQLLIQNLKRYLNPIGLNATLFGKPQIKSLRNYLSAVGRNFEAFGTARISYKEQKVAAEGIISTNYGDHLVAYAVRTIEMSTANGDMAQFGTQWIEYNPRYIQPRGIFEQLPSNHMVSPKIFIRPEGFDAARFGTRIIPDIQTIYLQGFAGSFGSSEILNHRQYIKPKGFLTVGEFPEYRWGRADIWNQTQYIHAQGIKQPNLNLPNLSRTTVENRNRTITTFGTFHQRFGYQQIENIARVLSPLGIYSPIEVNPTKTTITDRIRFIRVKGIEPLIISSWHHVRLGARLIKPKGFNANIFGTLHSENTRRNFRFIGMGEQSRFGQAMISEAVRTLSFEYRNTIAPPQIPLPIVKLGTRYITPVGIDSSRLGWSYLNIHWNKLYPRWIDKSAVGEPIVRNVTPELKGRGLDLSEFGQARIDLYSRYVRLDGLKSEIFGQSKIDDNKQIIQVVGIAPLLITRFHEVERLGGQYIPQLIDFTGRGISTKNFDDTNLHKVTQNIIRPESKVPMSLFGETVVTANTIRVEPGYWDILIGVPTVTHKNRQIFVSQFKDVFEPSKQRVSPHTIYAGIINPPEQAIKNHVIPSLQLHPIDGLDGKGQLKEPGTEFGTPSVTHFHRRFNINGNDFSQFGRAELKQTNFYIRPKGWNSLRMGMIAPLGDQILSFRKGIEDAGFGLPKVGHIEQFHRIIKVQGINEPVINKPEIQLFHRNIYPVGFNAQKMGTRKDNDQPYLWQGLRVGEHIPTNVGGGDMSVFGISSISLWVREINPVGLDYALVNEYDYTEFELRMRVIREDLSEQNKPSQQIRPIGFTATSFNASDIKNKVHFIRPDGNADQYRKGAF